MSKEILPPELEKRLKNAQWSRDTVGCSPAAVYKISGLDSGCNAYLKIQEPVTGFNLRDESDILKWLKGKLPVPEVMYFNEQKGRQFLMISEIKGLNSAHPSLTDKPDQLIRLLARGLRTIHSIYIGNCPIYHSLDKKLLEAEDRVKNVFPQTGVTYGFFSERKAERLLEKLKLTRPESQDLVFTHGDYCLPNIIIDNNEISGFIDWGQGGIADRYQDIALVSRSIAYNLGSKKWVELFYNEYGLEYIDQQKIEYYMMLDEFFQT